MTRTLNTILVDVKYMSLEKVNFGQGSISTFLI